MAMQGLGLDYDLSQGVAAGKSQAAKGQKEGSFKDHTGTMYKEKYVELINGVNYIIFLEYGHSKSAPAGMVRVSMRSMRKGALSYEIAARFREDWRVSMRQIRRGTATMRGIGSGHRAAWASHLGRQ